MRLISFSKTSAPISDQSSPNSAGGILVSGEPRCSPASNTAILALGTLLASIVGTTGAAMILIRPVIRANVWPLPMPFAARGFLVHRRVDARRHGNTPACVPWPTHHSCSL